LLTFNAAIGFRHSQGAGKALELLKKRLVIKVKLLRNRKWVIMDAREIVPGDVFILGLGDIIPADSKILSGEVSVDQSALTGASLPAKAERSNLVYSGSIVKRGEAIAVAVNTGVNTFFGRSAELVKMAIPKSHQEEIMMSIVRYMLYLGVTAVSITTIYAVVFHVDDGLVAIVTFAVILLMAAIPVALPAVLSIAQAYSALELAKRGALVTNLDSVEDAASIDTPFLDKTGAVTQNSLEVADVIPFSIFSLNDVTPYGALASKGEGRDLIDLAVIKHAKTLRYYTGSYKQVSFVPFDQSTKRSEGTIVDSQGNQFKSIKGAPQVIVGLCKGLDYAAKNSIDKTVEDLSIKGYRTLGVAKSTDDSTKILILSVFWH
jgi:H+-transporting ATPase